MKRLLLLLFISLPVLIMAQVGINTETPRALLDIKAENENALTNTAGVMVTEDGLLIPRVTTLLVDGDQPIGGLLVFLTTSFTDTTPDPDVVYEPGFYVSYGATWETFGDGTGSSLGQLRLVDEGGTLAGYRLNGVDAANYGNIGSFATDLGFQQSLSTTRGATGEFSFAAGIDNTSSGDISATFGFNNINDGNSSFIAGTNNSVTAASSASFGDNNSVSATGSFVAGLQNSVTNINSVAFGFSSIASGETSAAFGDDTEAKANSSFVVGEGNTDYTVNDDGTDRLFVVGNGVTLTSRSDAFIVQRDGTITAPSLSVAEIDAAGNTALITKEYLDANNGTGELAEFTEDGETGYRLADADAANHGDIGDFAVDLSLQQSASTTRGATGAASFVANVDNTASGAAAAAFGLQNEASGQGAGAFGQANTVSGVASFAAGSSNTVSGRESFSSGTANEVSGNTSGSMGNNNLITANSSVAFGNDIVIESPFSIAVGDDNLASGEASAVFGTGNSTGGTNSVAMGNESTTEGDAAVAMGTGIDAVSDNEVAIGSFNTNYTAQEDATDRAFVIGNGSADDSRSDALIVLKNGTITAPSLSTAEIDAAGNSALITKEYLDANGGSGELAEVTESGNTGYRLTDGNAANYGDTGSNAVDLSIQSAASSTTGATGSNAFAAGQNVTASGINSTAIGEIAVASGENAVSIGSSTASGEGALALGNEAVASGDFSTAAGFQSVASGDGSTAFGVTTAPSFGETTFGFLNTVYVPGSANLPVLTDRLFTIGNGTVDGGGAITQSDALIVLKNGTITAPSFSTAEIDAAGNSALITKEYLDANGGSGELAEVTEGGNTGYRLTDSDPSNYGNIGSNAVDLSISDSSSTTRGATGFVSTAMGVTTTASGSRSTAMGDSTIASGAISTAMGSNTNASGETSTAMGNNTTASGEDSTAMGINTTASGENSTAFGNGSLASGTESIAMGTNAVANATNSTAFGLNTEASGEGSTALGNSSIASGPISTAIGFRSTASGNQSFAMGNITVASGSSSSALGNNTIAANSFETALGTFNVADTDFVNLFVVGNGTSDAARSNALLVTENGTITAPSFSTAEIDAAGDKALITKEYFEANDNAGTAGVALITEAGRQGYRRTDANSSNFGNIGFGAFDLSFQVFASSTTGATGTYSSAFGANTTSSGLVSTAIGRRSVASGAYSTAIGNSVFARAENEISMGSYNTDYTVQNNDTDRAFTVGVGVDGSPSDALIVLKNGTITAPSLSVADIDAAGNAALTTKEFTDENYIGRLPSGNTASRPTGVSAPAFGTMRYNTETGRPEVYVENSTNLAPGSTFIPGWITL